MRVKNICVCRGSDKVFFLVTPCSQDSSIERLCLKAVNEGSSEEIPSILLPFSAPISGRFRNPYVAIVPDIPNANIKLAFSQVVNGAVKTDELRLSSNDIKWQSRLNYRIHKDICRYIRDYDQSRMSSLLNVKWLMCIEDCQQNEDILRFTVTSHYDDDSIEVSVLDSRGETYGSAPILMGTRQLPSRRSGSLIDREVTYSVRINRPNATLTFGLKSKKHPELNCFAMLDMGEYRRLLAEASRFMMNAQSDPYYPEWFRLHKSDALTLDIQSSSRLPLMPLFSLIVPLYKTPVRLFSEMVNSVIAQSYSKWELILVNASPEMDELSEAASDFATNDSRIKVITLEKNLGISENTNAGIDVARGDFVAFFDHDDTLEPNALFEYAQACNQHHDVDVIYCDEDKLRPDGSLYDPYFKTDYNPDLLMSNNYICHLLAIRRSLLSVLKPNTSEFDGAQDHNLVLEATEKARYVHHVARVLYHWRATEGSTAASSDSKPYASLAGTKAVQAHIDRMGIQASVEVGRIPFTYRIKYEMPRPCPLVSIVIPSKDHVEVLRTCLDSIRSKTTYPSFEIIVVDNGSSSSETKDYYEAISRDSSFELRIVDYPQVFNFSAMVNAGAREARGSYLLLLNNDTEVITPSWIEELLGPCLREDVGAVGARLYYRDDTIQHAGGCFAGGEAQHFSVGLPRGNWGYFNLADFTQDVSLVTAACMLVKREAFRAVGGFTEELAVEWNDVDFCFKLQEHGFRVVYTPEAELYHYESLTRGRNDSPEQWVRAHREKALLNERWADRFVRGDPYLNRNLAFEGPSCGYRGF